MGFLQEKEEPEYAFELKKQEEEYEKKRQKLQILYGENQPGLDLQILVIVKIILSCTSIWRKCTCMGVHLLVSQKWHRFSEVGRHTNCLQVKLRQIHARQHLVKTHIQHIYKTDRHSVKHQPATSQFFN